MRGYKITAFALLIIILDGGGLMPRGSNSSGSVFVASRQESPSHSLGCSLGIESFSQIKGSWVIDDYQAVNEYIVQKTTGIESNALGEASPSMLHGVWHFGVSGLRIFTLGEGGKDLANFRFCFTPGSDSEGRLSLEKVGGATPGRGLVFEVKELSRLSFTLMMAGEQNPSRGFGFKRPEMSERVAGVTLENVTDPRII